YIETVAPIKSQAEHLAQSGCHHRDVTARRYPKDALSVELIRIEPPQIANVEDPVMGKHCRNDVPLRCGDVDHSCDHSAGRDFVEFTVVRFHRIEVPSNRDHAVPGSVRLEVAVDRIRW